MADPLGEKDSETAAFTEQVQQRGPFTSAGDADQVTRATLAGLGEAVSGGQMDTLIAALPEHFHPDSASETGHAKTVDVPAFLDRVGGYSSSVEPATVERQVRAVLSTVADWQSSSQTIQDTFDQLPPQLADLFHQSGTG